MRRGQGRKRRVCSGVRGGEEATGVQRRRSSRALLAVSPKQRRHGRGRVCGRGRWAKGLGRAGLNLPPSHHQNLRTASDDQQLKDILLNIRSTKSSAVINYGASWCRVCSQILPAFCQLSNHFPKLSFVYADIDECPETTQHVRYTPTFHFFRDGERVDEMLGGGEERLHDRLWLHS